MPQNRRELTVKAILIALVLSVVMTAAMAYLALYAGMTVAAAIPAVVMAILLTRRRATVWEVNIIATGASAGESLAAGIAFTLPALILLGIWKQFDYVTTVLVALCGGILGSLLMIPFRKIFISPRDSRGEKLEFPEGTATAGVIQSACASGSGTTWDIVWGALLGVVNKVFLQGAIVLKGTVEGAAQIGKSVFGIGMDTSVALTGVGYIIGFSAAVQVASGGLVAWLIAIPLYTHLHPFPADMPAIDIANTVWNEQIRYLGVGAMIVGGIWNIFKMRSQILQSLKFVSQTLTGSSDTDNAIEERDLGGKTILGISALCAAVMLGLYLYQTPTIIVGVASWVLMLIAAFFFVAVSVYTVGLIGSSNNPVSGMVISALLLAGALMTLFGLTGTAGMVATLIVAGVVCSAAATGGEIAQTLKTGAILKSSPRNMQIIQIICVIASALVMPLILHQLHAAYGIGTGLKAPQAKMFAAITQMMFDPAKGVPWPMVYSGVGIGVFLIALGAVVKHFTNGKVGVSVMAVAVGIYLPVSLATPMLIGGFVRYLRGERAGEVEGSDRGTMFASGLIAGEAITAIILSIPIGLGWAGWNIFPSTALSLGLIAFCSFSLWRFARK